MQSVIGSRGEQYAIHANDLSRTYAHAAGSDRWKALSESEQKAIYADYTDLNKTEGVTPGLPLGLPDAARTVQVHDGKAHVKNGPYLAECVGGYYLFEAESVEAAIDMAARVPAARLGGAVEIRPTEKYW